MYEIKTMTRLISTRHIEEYSNHITEILKCAHRIIDTSVGLTKSYLHWCKYVYNTYIITIRALEIEMMTCTTIKFYFFSYNCIQPIYRHSTTRQLMSIWKVKQQRERF